VCVFLCVQCLFSSCLHTRKRLQTRWFLISSVIIWQLIWSFWKGRINTMHLHCLQKWDLLIFDGKQVENAHQRFAFQTSVFAVVFECAIFPVRACYSRFLIVSSTWIRYRITVIGIQDGIYLYNWIWSSYSR
jgi:hypothetical protein